MAVTQQLARLTADELAQCRSSVQMLSRLCSFQLRPRDDYLDLDWSPRPLELAAARIDMTLAAAIHHACTGGDEINPAYREHPGSVFEHPVRGLEPATVGTVAATLVRWKPDDVVSALPSDSDTAMRDVGMDEFSGHPGEYLRGHYEELRGFYATAAARGHATATWWD